MVKLKEYVAQQVIGKKLYFECDCLFPLNVTGTIKDYEIIDNEIMFLVDVDGKIIHIFENHPGMQVTEK